MRKISANYIYPISSKPIKNGILVVDNNGKICDIINNNGKYKETANVEFYNGILVPGFINTHCHLELSYLKNKITNIKDLPDFIEKIIKSRDIQGLTRSETLNISTKRADQEMQKNGIVAVGDISNTIRSSEIKKQSKIYYHTFIELSNIKSEFDNSTFEKGLNLKKVFGKNSSIVPHSPYSITPRLLKTILNFATKEQNIISIHNQETKSENELYFYKKGAIYELLTKYGNIKTWFKKTGKTSLQSILPLFSTKSNILLIHNIYTSMQDIQFAEKFSENIYWTFCPNSNLNIENKLPIIEFFIKNNCKITIGTDSLSSNNKLDILAEMKILSEEIESQSFTSSETLSTTTFDEILQWATINGAKALKIDDKYGSFEIGKIPGINLIKGFDFENKKLKKNCEILTL